MCFKKIVGAVGGIVPNLLIRHKMPSLFQLAAKNPVGGIGVAKTVSKKLGAPTSGASLFTERLG